MSHSHQKRPIKRKHQEITNDGISKEFKIVFMHMLKYLKKNKNIMMRKIGDIKKKQMQLLAMKQYNLLDE